MNCSSNLCTSGCTTGCLSYPICSPICIYDCSPPLWATWPNIQINRCVGNCYPTACCCTNSCSCKNC